MLYDFQISMWLNKDVSRKARWYFEVMSDVLKDYGLRPMKPTHAAKENAAKSIPDTMFDAEGTRCSMEDELHDLLFKTGLNTLSPQALNLVPLSFIAALQFPVQTNKLRFSWLSLLCNQKMLLKEKPKGPGEAMKAGLVSTPNVYDIEIQKYPIFSKDI